MAQQNQGEVEWPQYAAQCLFVHWGQIVQRMVVPIHLQGNWKVIEFLKRRYQNICQSNVATEWPRKIRDRSNSYDMLLNTCFYYKDKWYKVWRSQSVYKAIESWQNFWKAMPIFLSIQWRHQAAKKNQRKVACPQYAAKCLFVHWGQIVQSMIVPIRLQGDQKLTEFFEKQCQYFCQSNGAIKWSSKIREVKWPQYAVKCLFVHWGQIVQCMVVPICLQGNSKVTEFSKKKMLNVCQSNGATEWPSKIRKRLNNYDILSNACWYIANNYYKVLWPQSIYKAIKSW